MLKMRVNERGLTIFLILGSLSLLTYSSIYMIDMRVSPVTQSPFYLYEDIPYIVAILFTALSIAILSIKGNSNTMSTIILTIILWSMVLAEPYLTYIGALPLYNDQLGFVAEVIAMLSTGKAVALQGDVTSLGHAYFTSALALFTGINGIDASIIVQFIMPIIYAIVYMALASISNDRRLYVFIPMFVLASFLNPFWYGRTPFAWLLLAILTLIIYKLFTTKGNEANALRIAFYVIYAAYSISDPTSLFIPIIFAAASILRRRYTSLFIVSALIWFTVNLIATISGSLYSAVMELITLFTAPSNPIPALLTPGVNAVMMIYYRLREINIFLMYLIGLIVTITYVIDRFRKRNSGFSKDVMTILYIISVIMEAIALVINRWGMVPYTLFTLTVLPLIAILFKNYVSRTWALLLTITLALIIIAPAVKWGFAAIAFPTANDIVESQFLATYSTQSIQVCTAGAHEILWFYSYLNNKTVNQYALNLPLTYDVPNTCNVIAIFYRAMNTYRLDITKNQLLQTINYLDSNQDVIYKDGLWTIWSR